MSLLSADSLVTDSPAISVSAAESDAYFESRPLGSRLGAWASPQSEVVAGRAVLEERFADAQRRYGETVPRPPHWGGYRVVPRTMEFWQGRENRLHDRLLYARAGTGFKATSWNLSRDSKPFAYDIPPLLQAGLGVPNLMPGTRYAGPETSMRST